MLRSRQQTGAEYYGTSADDRNTTSSPMGSEYSTSQVTDRTFLPLTGIRIVDQWVQTAVFAVSVKPDVVVSGPEVVLRPRYHAATCISPSLIHLFDIKAASPLHMDGSVVFARFHQCAPHLIHASLAHPNPQPKQHLDRFSHFCTAHGRASVYFTMGRPSPSKLTIPMGDLDPNLIHGSLSPIESWTQTASRSVQPFLHSSLLWQTDWQTVRPTQHATRSVTVGHIYVRSTAMRPNNVLWHHITETV